MDIFWRAVDAVVGGTGSDDEEEEGGGGGLYVTPTMHQDVFASEDDSSESSSEFARHHDVLQVKRVLRGIDARIVTDQLFVVDAEGRRHAHHERFLCCSTSAIYQRIHQMTQGTGILNALHTRQHPIYLLCRDAAILCALADYCAASTGTLPRHPHRATESTHTSMRRRGLLEDLSDSSGIVEPLHTVIDVGEHTTTNGRPAARFAGMPPEDQYESVRRNEEGAGRRRNRGAPLPRQSLGMLIVDDSAISSGSDDPDALFDFDDSGSDDDDDDSFSGGGVFSPAGLIAVRRSAVIQNYERVTQVDRPTALEWYRREFVDTQWFEVDPVLATLLCTMAATSGGGDTVIPEEAPLPPPSPLVPGDTGGDMAIPGERSPPLLSPTTAAAELVGEEGGGVGWVTEETT